MPKSSANLCSDVNDIPMVSARYSWLQMIFQESLNLWMLHGCQNKDMVPK